MAMYSGILSREEHKRLFRAGGDGEFRYALIGLLGFGGTKWDDEATSILTYL